MALPIAEAAIARRSTLGGTVSVPPGGTDAPMAVSPVPSIMMPSPPPMFHPVPADRARPTWASCAAIFDNIVAWLPARGKVHIAARGRKGVWWGKSVAGILDDGKR